jgi:hypothetical protein
MLFALPGIFRALGIVHHLWSWAGCGLLALGLLGQICVGCLARFSGMYDQLHIAMAFATFIAISAGLAVCFGLAAWLHRNLGLGLLAGIQFLAVSILTYMLFHPDFPPERSFLSSLAFLEWTLCSMFVAFMLALTASLALPAVHDSRLPDPQQPHLSRVRAGLQQGKIGRIQWRQSSCPCSLSTWRNTTTSTPIRGTKFCTGLGYRSFWRESFCWR